MFPGDYLNTHLAIALTFIDSYKPDEIQAIKDQITVSLQNELGMDNVRFFEVSNSRYKKWQEETDEKNSVLMSPFHRRRGRQIHGSPSKALRNSVSEPAILPALSLFFFLFLIAFLSLQSSAGHCFVHAGDLCVKLPYPHLFRP